MILIDLIPPGLTFRPLWDLRRAPVLNRLQSPEQVRRGRWAIETIGWCGGWSSQQTPCSFRAIASGNMRRAHLHRLRHHPEYPWVLPH